MTFYGASVIGRSHRRQGRGGQDAWAGRPLKGGGYVVAVADGCSAGRANEIGAGVGARAAVVSAARRIACLQQGERLELDALRALPAVVVADVIEEVRRLARALAVDADDAAQSIEEALLFTLHVAVVTNDRCVAFGVGDGVVCIDDDVIVVDQGAAPDYPAYSLFTGLAQPRVLTHYVGRAPRALALCTDGARELIARADERVGDGTSVGGVAWFMHEERCVKNTSLAQKRLQSWVEHTGGPIDDCTLVVIRNDHEVANVVANAIAPLAATRGDA